MAVMSERLILRSCMLQFSGPPVRSHNRCCSPAWALLLLTFAQSKRQADSSLLCLWEELKFAPQVPAAFIGNTATILGITPEYRDEDLEKYFRDQDVLRACRRYTVREGKIQRLPLPRTKLRCSSPQILKAQNELTWAFGAQKSENE